MNTELFLHEKIWYKRFINWKKRLILTVTIGILFFFMNLHLVAIEFKYVKFKYENKTYVKRLQYYEISCSWIKVSFF